MSYGLSLTQFLLEPSLYTHNYQHPVFNDRDRSSLTEHKLSVVVGDTLGKVEITLLTVAILVREGGTEHGDLAAALDGKVDVLGGVGEVDTVPLEVTYDPKH